MRDPPNLLGPKRANFSKKRRKKLHTLVQNGPNFDNLKSATLEPTNQSINQFIEWNHLS